MYPVIQIRSQIGRVMEVFCRKLLLMISFNSELLHSPRPMIIIIIIIIVTCQAGTLGATIMFPGVMIGNGELTSIQPAVS